MTTLTYKSIFFLKIVKDRRALKRPKIQACLLNFQLGVIHLIRTQIFPKDQLFLSPGMDKYAQVRALRGWGGGRGAVRIASFDCITQYQKMRALIFIQPTNKYSKLTIETLEQDVKYVQVNKKDTRTTLLTSFWCLYC